VGEEAGKKLSSMKRVLETEGGKEGRNSLSYGKGGKIP